MDQGLPKPAGDTTLVKIPRCEVGEIEAIRVERSELPLDENSAVLTDSTGLDSKANESRIDKVQPYKNSFTISGQYEELQFSEHWDGIHYSCLFQRNSINREVKSRSFSNSESSKPYLEETLKYITDISNAKKNLQASFQQESLQMEDLELSSNLEEDASSGKSNSKNRESKERILNIKASERNLPCFEEKSVSNIPGKHSTAIASGERDLILPDDPDGSCPKSIFEQISESQVQDDDKDEQRCFSKEVFAFNELQSILYEIMVPKEFIDPEKKHLMKASDESDCERFISNLPVKQIPAVDSCEQHTCGYPSKCSVVLDSPFRRCSRDVCRDVQYDKNEPCYSNRSGHFQMASISNDNLDVMKGNPESVMNSIITNKTSNPSDIRDSSNYCLSKIVQRMKNDKNQKELAKIRTDNMQNAPPEIHQTLQPGFEDIQTRASGEEKPKDFKRLSTYSNEERKPKIQKTTHKSYCSSSNLQLTKSFVSTSKEISQTQPSYFEAIQTGVSGVENQKDFKRSPTCSPEERKPKMQKTTHENSRSSSNLQLTKSSAST